MYHILERVVTRDSEYGGILARPQVLLMSQFCPLRTRTTVLLKTWNILLNAYLTRSSPHTFHT